MGTSLRPELGDQRATSNASADVSNKAKTDQDQHLSQNIGGGSCLAGCGGPGGFQLGAQVAETNQWAAGAAVSNQNAVNGNAPTSTAGGNIASGPSSATPDRNLQRQHRRLEQGQDRPGPGPEAGHRRGKDCGCSKDGHDGPSAGSGGAGGFQAGIQAAETNQWALGISESDQNAVNANAPTSTAGGNIASGPSSASQTATSSANTDVSNKAKTDQDQGLKQNIGGDKDCGCSKDGHDGPSAGSGGAGGAQLGVQLASTNQWAAGAAFSDQNAVNSNTPSSTAGGNIYAGPSSATQTATSTGTTDVSNRAKTDQNQWQHQQLPVWRI